MGIDIRKANLLNIREVAEIMKCSKSNVYKLIEIGELPIYTVGLRKGYRVPENEVHRFLEKKHADFFAA